MLKFKESAVLKSDPKTKHLTDYVKEQKLES